MTLRFCGRLAFMTAWMALASIASAQQEGEDEDAIPGAPIRTAVYRGTMIVDDQSADFQLAVLQRGDTAFTAYVRVGASLPGTGWAYGWMEQERALAIVVLSADGDTVVWRTDEIAGELRGQYEFTGGPNTGRAGTWEATLVRGPGIAPPGEPPPSAGPSDVSAYWFVVVGWIALAIVLIKWVVSAPVITIPEAPTSIEQGPIGVGGWMVLFLIGQGFITLQALVEVLMFEDTLASWGFGHVIPSFWPLLTLETIVPTSQLILSPLGIVLTVRKWRGVPRFWVAYLSWVLGYAIIDQLALAQLIPDMGVYWGPELRSEMENIMAQGWRENARAFLYVPIWVAYWSRARRVRWTFGAGAFGAAPLAGMIRIPQRTQAATPDADDLSSAGEEPPVSGTTANLPASSSGEPTPGAKQG